MAQTWIMVGSRLWSADWPILVCGDQQVEYWGRSATLHFAVNVGSAVPAIETGWEAAAYTKRTFTVPDDWKAGRIWVDSSIISARQGNDVIVSDARVVVIATSPLIPAQIPALTVDAMAVCNAILVPARVYPQLVSQNGLSALQMAWIGMMQHCWMRGGRMRRGSRPRLPRSSEGTLRFNWIPSGLQGKQKFSTIELLPVSQTSMETRLIRPTAAQARTVLRLPALLPAFNIIPISRTAARALTSTPTMSRAVLLSGLAPLRRKLIIH
ncbi:hypothetical protein FRC07_014007 [Ceratobasidium sp. 392]|nr:hypothetical protein FRC07_014007 [Ceratobasidium sp. 392]